MVRGSECRSYCRRIERLQGHAELVALPNIAHFGDPFVGNRGAGGRLRDDCFGFGGKGSEGFRQDLGRHLGQQHGARPRYLVCWGRSQEAERREHASCLWDQDFTDTKLTRYLMRMERAAAAKGHHHCTFQVAATLCDIHTRGLGHILVHDLDDCRCSLYWCHPQGLAYIASDGVFGGLNV